MHSITRKEAGLMDRILADYAYVKYKCWMNERYETDNKEDITRIMDEVNFVRQYIQIKNIKGRIYHDFIEVDEMFNFGGLGHDEMLDNLEIILDNQIIILNETFEELSEIIEWIGEDLGRYSFDLDDMNHYAFNYYGDIKYEDITRSLIHDELRESFKTAKGQLLDNIAHINSIKNEILLSEI